MTALLFVFLFGPGIIQALKIRQGRGQPIRADGPQTHLAKAGTPTMGGLMIMSGVLVSTLLWANLSNVYVWSVLLVTTGFGLIGLYDDYLKVTKATAKNGFSGRARLGHRGAHRRRRGAHDDRLRRPEAAHLDRAALLQGLRRSTSAISTSSSAPS